MLIGRDGVRQRIDFGMNLRDERPPVELRDGDSGKRGEFDRRLAGLCAGHQPVELQAFGERPPAGEDVQRFLEFGLVLEFIVRRRVGGGRVRNAVACERGLGLQSLKAKPGRARNATVREPLIVVFFRLVEGRAFFRIGRTLGHDEADLDELGPPRVGNVKRAGDVRRRRGPKANGRRRRVRPIEPESPVGRLHARHKDFAGSVEHGVRPQVVADRGVPTPIPVRIVHAELGERPLRDFQLTQRNLEISIVRASRS